MNPMMPLANKRGPKGDPIYKPTPEERERFNLSIIEGRTIRAAMEYAGGSRAKASKLLGIDRRTLDRWLGPGL